MKLADKRFSLLVVALITLCLFSFATAGATSLTAKVASNYAVIGDTVTVSINTYASSSISGYTVTVSFDSSLVTYLTTTAGSPLSSRTFTATFYGDSAKAVRASGPGALFSGSGTLYTLSLKAKTAGTTTITFHQKIFNGNGYGKYVTIDTTTTTYVIVETAAPVVFSSFVGTYSIGNGVQLDWQTASEYNSYSFDVQRSASSTEGFATLEGSMQQAATESLVPQSYSYVDASATPGTWYYRVREVDLDNSERYTEAVTVVVPSASTETAIASTAVPQAYGLSQNYPNPFNPTTNIQFSLPKTEQVRIVVYDAIGREIATLANSAFSAGTHQITWNAQTMPSGMYFCKMTAGSFSSVRSMLLVK